MEKTLRVNISDTRWLPAVTSDSGANMAKAVDESERMFWMKCVLHIIHNTVMAGMDSPLLKDGVVKKCKEFIAHLTSTNKGADRFKAIQREIIEENRQADEQAAADAAQAAVVSDLVGNSGSASAT